MVGVRDNDGDLTKQLKVVRWWRLIEIIIILIKHIQARLVVRIYKRLNDLIKDCGGIVQSTVEMFIVGDG